MVSHGVFTFYPPSNEQASLCINRTVTSCAYELGTVSKRTERKTQIKTCAFFKAKHADLLIFTLFNVTNVCLGLEAKLLTTSSEHI